MNNILEVNALSKHYADVVAVDSIDFVVTRGSCFGLLGPNGAGKTTTLEMLEGITTPTSGTISFDGKQANKATFQRFGIQFQHTALQDYLTVRETLRMFSAFYTDTMAIDELIQLCSLSEFAERRHNKLSGGQRQRLLMALALINKPELVFLDEPTTGLDPQARRDFWYLIEKVKQQGCSIILTTHYMDEAECLCDQIAVMDKGKIISQGQPKQLLTQHFDGVLVRLPKQNWPINAAPSAATQANDVIEIQTNNVEDTLSRLIADGVSLDGLQVKSANLDDLFLKLTGHQLVGEDDV